MKKGGALNKRAKIHKLLHYQQELSKLYLIYTYNSHAQYDAYKIKCNITSCDKMSKPVNGQNEDLTT